MLRLPRHARAKLASLDDADEPALAALWSDHLERRSRGVADGAAQPVAWTTARADLLGELEQRRARRSPP